MKNLFILVATGVLLLTGCTSSTKVEEPVKTLKEGEIDYSNQANWTFVSGKMQSPIDIVTKDVVEAEHMDKIHVEFNKEVEAIVDNGHSIEVEGEGESMMDGRTFTFKQVHFHSASEHEIDGKSSPLEAHFVHQSQSGRLAVIGVLFEIGESNPAFETILNEIGKEKVELDLTQLLPSDLSFYHYLGSLTTPPLTENVEWYVLKNKMTISQEQLDKFNEYYNGNNRDVQDINGRIVVSGK